MITITIDGKTYKVEKPEKSSITIEALISAWIKSGVLEEVKENKEHPMIKCVRADLLREELERRKNTMKVDNDEVESIYEELLDFLTSLETKEEPQIKISGTFVYEPYNMEAPNYEKFNQKLNCKEWTPTPGEMIEVSNDGEKWESDYEYKGKDDEGYIVKRNGCTVHAPFIRKPQPQEDIELLPEYQLRTQDNGRHRMTPSHEEKQIILLTETVNKLIKANKK